jgi:SAM-dependent methyltransferase
VIDSDRRDYERSPDFGTAAAFAESWNRVGEGSIYTRDQFLDWMGPLDPAAFRDREVIELGFGNGSLLYHFAAYAPRRLAGIELGDTIGQTLQNLEGTPHEMLDLHRGDLTTSTLGEFDLAYSIGVIHHLRNPEDGFTALLRHTRPGGRFHGWVYAREGNTIVIYLVDPLRRLTSRLPWWITKYLVALPLAAIYFVYARTIALAGSTPALDRIARRIAPLYDYSRWIARRGPRFFHHVAFDQLVTPQTSYLPRSMVERWLASADVEPGSTYLVFRNGNSWKFGGRRES